MGQLNTLPVVVFIFQTVIAGITGIHFAHNVSNTSLEKR